MNFIVLGPPGAGKTTQGEILAKRAGLRLISRESAPNGRAVFSERPNRQLRLDFGQDKPPPEYFANDIRELFRGSKAEGSWAGAVFDSYPTTLVQAMALQQLLTDRRQEIDAVIVLDAPADLLHERFSPGFGFSSRLRHFERNIDQILKFYNIKAPIIRVSTTAPVQAVASQIWREILSIVQSHINKGKFDIPVALIPISELELSVRTANLLISSGFEVVGDVAVKTESQLIRIAKFGRKSLNELKEVLHSFGVTLGAEVEKIPPLLDPVPDAEILRVLHDAKQIHVGAKFEPKDERFEISAEVTNSDQEAASDPMTKQLHEEAVRKLRQFEAQARRLDNQVGWAGIENLSTRFIKLLDRPTIEVPEVIGLVYSFALEFGSYLEQDMRIRSGEPSYAEALEPEVRRSLEDFVRTAAPWVRRFPSAREADEELGGFLSQVSLAPAATDAVNHAVQENLITPSTAATLLELLRTAEREGTISGKATKRGVFSARNLVVAAAGTAMSLVIGAIGSDLAVKSILIQRAGSFLVSAEKPIMELVADMPADLRLAFQLLIKEIPSEPVILPPPAIVPRRPGRASKSDK